MTRLSSPVAAQLGPRDELPSRQTPWNCGWAHVAGTVRTAPTADAPGVLWSCRIRERAAAPLFTREECRACGRWCPREGIVSADWTSGACASPPSSASPIRHVHYRRGSPIIQEGAPADVLYTILSGTAKLFKLTSSGSAIGIGISVPGSPLGAEWILEGSSFATMAVALEGTTCIAAPRHVVVSLLDRHPLLLRELLCEISQRERYLMGRIAELGGARVEARFAHLFLELAVRVGVREHGQIVIRTPLLRQDLADLAGTTVETSIRLMSRWNKQGIVTTRAGGFVIRDRTTLEHLRRS